MFSVKEVALYTSFVSTALFISACEPEAVRKNEEIIRQQAAEIRRLRQENEEIAAEKVTSRRKTDACNRAFSSFERAQAAREPRGAVAFYRDGLKLCPDDDVARYELGKVLAGMGLRDEAREEFEAALKINPNFKGAKQELEKLRR